MPEGGSWGEAPALPEDENLERLAPIDSGIVDEQTGMVIKQFNLPAINKAIQEAVASIPPGEHVAVIGIANKTGAKLGGVVKLGAHWSAMGAYSHAWPGKKVPASGFEAAILFHW